MEMSFYKMFDQYFTFDQYCFDAYFIELNSFFFELIAAYRKKNGFHIFSSKKENSEEILSNQHVQKKRFD